MARTDAGPAPTLDDIKPSDQFMYEGVKATVYKTDLWKERMEIAALMGGVKHDQGKTRYELLAPEALEELAKVLTFGAVKYASHNWRKGMDWSRVLGAAMRHLWAWARGEDNDPESGLSHLAHAMCCVMFLITYQKTATGKDDRYKEIGS